MGNGDERIVGVQGEFVGGILKSMNDIQLNALGESSILKTAMGNAEVFFDYFGDSDLEGESAGVYQINKMGDLFTLDSNGNGFLNRDDADFSRLKIRVYKGVGKYETAHLSDVVGMIDLYGFIRRYDKNNVSQIKGWRDSYSTQREIMVKGRLQTNVFHLYDDIRAYRDSEMKLFAPEQHYIRIKQEDIRAMFEAYVDSVGWMNLEYKAINEALFASGDFISNFAYKKTNLAGVEVLE